MSKTKPLSLAERSRRFRKKRKAELLRNENYLLRRQLEQLTAKSCPKTSERTHAAL
jgi:hypothetical protein